MTDTTSTDLTGPEPKAAKRTTQKDINALLAAFEPQRSAPESVASRVRRHRHQEIDRLFAGIVADLCDDSPVTDVEDTRVIITDGDLALAEKTLKGLATARAAAHKAVDSIPDSKLDPDAKPAAKTTKAARVSVPKIAADTAPAYAAKAGFEDSSPSPEPKRVGGPTIEEMAAENAARRADAEEHPEPDDGGPRGLVDPNETDGF